jgi:hypothetical protein
LPEFAWPNPLAAVIAFLISAAAIVEVITDFLAPARGSYLSNAKTLRLGLMLESSLLLRL